MRKHENAIIIIIILVLIPTLKWLFTGSLSLKFFGFSSTVLSIGQLLGLIGMTLFAYNIILSARPKLLDKLIGLDWIYKYHHFIGSVAFMSLLFHPLFLAAKYLAFSPRTAAVFFLPSGDLPKTFGILALFLMMVVLYITFFVRLPYNKWKFSHMFMALVFVFAVIHVYFIPSNVATDIFLRWYILGLSFLGIILKIQRPLSKLFIKKNRYIVEKISLVADRVCEIEMKPTIGKIKYKPGQFFFFSFISDCISPEYHPFSVASSPQEENIRIVVKELGDYTGKLKCLKGGETVYLDGPFGKFSFLNLKNKNQVWIAGGIGITPFLSMARSVTEDCYVDFYYATKTKEEAVYLNELKEISEMKRGFRVFPWASDEQGMISSEVIRNFSGEFSDKEILLCGPGPMMKSLRSQFMEAGVDKKKIHFEDFSLL